MFILSRHDATTTTQCVALDAPLNEAKDWIAISGVRFSVQSQVRLLISDRLALAAGCPSAVKEQRKPLLETSRLVQLFLSE